MKKLLIILLFIPLLSLGQSQEVTIRQDVKLSLFNDNYGNTAPTLDAIIEWRVHQPEQTLYYFNYEVANLRHYYHRFSMGIGYGFKVSKISIEPAVEIGYIIHNGNWYHSSVGGSFNISVPVYNDYKISLFSTRLFRSDIQIWRNNFYLGLTKTL